MASDVVCAFEALTSDSFRQVVLLAGKSLPLVCRRFRDLCWRSVRGLRINGFDCFEDDALVLQVPQRFPNCKVLQFRADDSHHLTIELTRVLAVFARMPLEEFRLMITDSNASSPTPVSLLLELIRLQLTRLRFLSLDLSYGSLEVRSNGESLWPLLGRWTELTGLAVHLSADAQSFSSAPYIPLSSYSPLSSLTRLQKLSMTAEALTQTMWEHDYSPVLTALTGLTSLNLTLSSIPRLSCLSCCTNLQTLSLQGDCMSSEPFPRVSVISFDSLQIQAVAALTGLTGLHLPGIYGLATKQAALQLLGPLEHLRELTLEQITPEVLPVLAGLQSLSQLTAWQTVKWGAMTRVEEFPSIVKFAGAGPIPFRAFPNLEEAVLLTSWPCCNFMDLSRNCPKLRSIRQGFLVSGQPMIAPSIDVDEERLERWAAVKALAGLQQLTALECTPVNNGEVAALASLTQLKELYLLVAAPGAAWSRVTAKGLLKLRRLSRSLESFHLYAPELVLPAQERHQLKERFPYIMIHRRSPSGGGIDRWEVESDDSESDDSDSDSDDSV